MIFETGDKALIAHRRLFHEDAPRFFVGRIDEYEQGVVKITGCAWTRDATLGGMHKKEDQRTKIISVLSGTLIVYQLPDTVNLADLSIKHGHNQSMTLTDGNQFSMDLTERP